MITLSEDVERRLRTAVVYLAILSLGMCTSVPGPTLLDLAALVKEETSSLSFIYLGRSFGYLFGSFSGGVLLDYCRRTQILLLLYTFLMAAATIVIPWCRTLSFLFGIMTFSGMAMGALDTGLNVWCLSFWDDESSPYFQALHFFFGVGAFLAPLIAGNFLSHENQAQIKNSTDNLSLALSYNSSYEEKDIPEVVYPYSIIGIISLIVSIMFVLLFFINVNKVKSKEKTQYQNLPVHYRFLILFVFFLLLAIYAGIEIGFGQMIAVYAVKSNHHFSQSLASYITSMYWGTFTFSRGFSIFLALKFSPFCLVVGDFIVMTLASLLLVTVGNFNSVFLWIGSATLGLGLASFYASSITWLEMHITVTNKIGSGFVIAASFGEMLAPLAISQYVTEKPIILMYFVIVSTLICGFLIFFLRTITSCSGVKQPLPIESKMEPNGRSNFIDLTIFEKGRQDNMNSDTC